jgi:hypothetical protein
MAISDDDLLDFDYSRLSGRARAQAEELLSRHGDAYRDQLVIAKWLDRWCDDAAARSEGTDPEFLKGFAIALETAANILREGELLRDGGIYRSETNS